MSIYDDDFSEDPKKKPPAVPDPPNQLASAPPVDEGATAAEKPDSEPPKRRGCGCRSCLLVFLAFFLLSIAFCGVGSYLAYKQGPVWFHDAVVAAVNDSDLDAEQKRKIAAQMDRLLKEYKAGNVTRFDSAIEELTKSPLLVMMMAYGAMENFVAPSGLSDDEKAAARLAFQRVARGTFEKTIDPDDLEEALNYISTKDFNGNRNIKSRVSDADLRALVKECNRVADAAGVPNEPYEVDFAAEVERIVDRALGIPPEEVMVPEKVDSPAADATEPTEPAAETPESSEAAVPASESSET